jgi:hypothetical protein
MLDGIELRWLKGFIVSGFNFFFNVIPKDSRRMTKKNGPCNSAGTVFFMVGSFSFYSATSIILNGTEMIAW